MVNLPNGLLASAGNDKTIKIWNLADSTSKTFFINKGIINFLSTLKNGDLVSADSEGNVLLHIVNDGSYYTILSCPKSSISSSDFYLYWYFTPFCLARLFTCSAYKPIKLSDGGLAFAYNLISTYYINSFSSYCWSGTCTQFGNYFIPFLNYTILNNWLQNKEILDMNFIRSNYSLSYQSYQALYCDKDLNLLNNYGYTILQLPNGNLASGGDL